VRLAQGALMVGHDCGGLGKMPGFYFAAELDNIQDMAHRRAPPARPGEAAASVPASSCAVPA